ncbi:hypothetical protein M1446_03765 [Candidatus Dependentiae bacterium]|nr:hypothetical protein [Candidatus Dependentiae bacterium]
MKLRTFLVVTFALFSNVFSACNHKLTFDAQKSGYITIDLYFKMIKNAVDSCDVNLKEAKQNLKNHLTDLHKNLQNIVRCENSQIIKNRGECKEADECIALFSKQFVDGMMQQYKETKDSFFKKYKVASYENMKKDYDMHQKQYEEKLKNHKTNECCQKYIDTPEEDIFASFMVHLDDCLGAHSNF